MNWTGGRLSRHSRGGAPASLNQRQKAHFAKVQNNLRNGTKEQSPIKWSIFGKIQVQQVRRERKSSLEPQPTSREGTQQLHYGTSRHAKHSNHMVRDRHPSRSFERQYTREHTPTPAKTELVIDDDIYSTTPPPREKRKHETSVLVSGGYDEEEEEEVDSVAKKRKLLLEKGDWVGISYQRPLQLTFASPQHTENVGRRRKTTDGHRARYASRQTVWESPFMTRVRPRSRPSYNTQGQRGKTDVRIHIGNRVVPPGISSSTTPSRGCGHSTSRQIRNAPQVASSDVMLLDNDDVLSNAMSRIINETPFEDQQVESLSSGLYDEGDNFDEFHEDSEDNGDETGRDKEFSRSRDSQHVSDEHSSTPGQYRSSSMEVQNIPTRDSREPSISPILGTTFASFSPASIKQPIPQSSRVSSVLRSGSLEIAHSTVAQVGKVRPVVPSSQILDNEIWETWMASLYSEESLYDLTDEDGGSDQARSISPGISTAPVHRIRRPAPLRYQRDASGLEEEGFEKVDMASRMVNPSIGNYSINGSYQEERPPTRNILRRESADRSETRRIEERPRDIETMRHSTFMIPSPVPEFEVGDESNQLRNLHKGPRGGKAVAQAQATTSNKEKDPDEIWRTFVFGSDEADEIDHTSKAVLPLRFERQNSTASSMLGNPSNKIYDASQTHTARQYRNTLNRPASTPKSHTPSTIVSRADSSSSEIPWNPPTGITSTRMCSTRDGSTSFHASYGSLNSSHSDHMLPSDGSTPSSRPKRATTSLTIIACSQSGTSKTSENPPSLSPRPQKVVFTKPKRYEGVKSTSEPSQAEEEPLHTGRGLARESHGGLGEKEERDVYSLIDSDEIGSIEDD